MDYPFLQGGGELGSLIARHDWHKTRLGPIDQWSPSLRGTVSLMLQSPVPIVTLWGATGVMLYNDAYSLFAGDRHPALLGSDVLEGWGEVASFNDNVLKVVLHGNQPLSYREKELVLNRDGQLKKLWLDLDYSPVLDDTGQPIGVMAIVVETTERVQAERRLSEESARLSQLFEQSPSFMAVLRGPNHVFELANPLYLELIGHRSPVGKPLREVLPEVISQGYLDLLDQVYSTGQSYSAQSATYLSQSTDSADGKEWKVDFVFQPIKDVDGQVTGIFIDGFDVTERVRAEGRREALVSLTDAIRDIATPDELIYEAAAILGRTLVVSRVGYARFEPQGDLLYVSRDWTAPEAESIAGALRLRDFGSFVDDLKKNRTVIINDVEHDERTSGNADALIERSARSFVNIPIVEQGSLEAVLFVNDGNVRSWKEDDLALIREFAARLRTAEERLRSESALIEANENLEKRVAERTEELMKAEAALRQSQKMEAVGQLTGGLAHDFNNLLTAISGSLELLGTRVSEGRTTDLGRYIATAENAADRAASLTHRLLAFSRQQTLAPKPTDIIRLVGGIEELIRRTVGPAIQIEIVNAAGLWPSLIDPGQLENAVLNLCINARDAMPSGGKITIETGNRWFDQRVANERGVAPGQYVSLCVSDTGVGMSPETVAKAFDPFFTTKPIGMGTGLGLSMIYGFARQSGGAVSIYSEINEGTMVCVYLPRHTGDAVVEESQVESAEAPRGHEGETVLVVDDEPAIRVLITEVLQDLGYKTIEASDGSSALKVLGSHARLDLLITDVGLPGGMNGRQIADAARVARPELKILFITGYAENAVLSHGHLDPGMHVMTKPFGMDALASRVHDLISG